MIVWIFGMELTFEYTLTSYFYANPIQTCIDEGPALHELRCFLMPLGRSEVWFDEMGDFSKSPLKSRLATSEVQFNFTKMDLGRVDS